MSLLVESVVPLNISSSPFFLFMDSIKCHLCLPLRFSQGINLHSWLKPTQRVMSFFIFMTTIKWHLCLRLWFSQGINLDGWLQAYPTYHTGLATALGISYASRSAFET